MELIALQHCDLKMSWGQAPWNGGRFRKNYWNYVVQITDRRKVYPLLRGKAMSFENLVLKVDGRP
ncbi:hypothetical protein GCM10008940_02410 [Microbulbifer agarilyticus]